MTEPLCLGQGRDTIKIDISGHKPAPKEELIGGLGSLVLSIGGIFAAAAIKNGSSSSSESSSTSSQEAQYAAIVSQLMTPEGLNSVRLAESEFQGQLEQELEVLEQVLNNKNYGEEDLYIKHQQGTADVNYTKYAEAKIKELDTKRDSDFKTINTLRTQASMDISNTVKKGKASISIKDISSATEGAFIREWEDQKNNYDGWRKQPDANEKNYEQKQKQYDYYCDLLDLQTACLEQDQKIKIRNDAKRKLDDFKQTYGDNLDGQKGSYASNRQQQTNTITQANATIQSTEQSVVTNYTNNQALEAKEKLYDQLRNQYGMTKQTNPEGTPTSYTLTHQNKAEHRKQELTQAISMGREINSLIEKADRLISEVTTLQSNIEKFNEKDGTLWSRSKLRDIFVKGDKGKDQRAAKRNKSASKERLKTKQTELQSTVSRLVLLQSQRNAFMAQAEADRSAATSSTTSASTSTAGTTAT